MRLVDIVSRASQLARINDSAECSEWLLRMRDPAISRPMRPLALRPVNGSHP